MIQFNKPDSFNGNSTHKALVQDRICPICGGKDFTPLFSYANFHFFSDSSIDPKRVDINTVQCHECLCVCMNPVYTTWGFEKLFREAGQSYGSSAEAHIETYRWMEAEGLLESGNKVLDIGCYDGYFLGLLPNNIFKYGVDIDGPAIARGVKAHPEMTLIHSALENFSIPDKMDVITMFHLLEHLANPQDILTHLYAISSEKTRLVIEIPIIENGTNNDIVNLYTPQHLTHFSKNTLNLLLHKTGWRICKSLDVAGYNGYRIIAEKSETEENYMPDYNDKKYALQIVSGSAQAALAVEKRIDSFLQHNNHEHIIVWGAGMHTEALYQLTTLFSHTRRKKFVLVDSDSLKQGLSWRGIAIYPPSILNQVNLKNTLLIVSSYGGTKSIYTAVQEYNMPKENILTLYDTIAVR